MRKGTFEIYFNRNFGKVISSCAAPRADESQTWISDEIIAAYTELHEQGFAHSVECYRGDELAGGLYGLAIGGAFFGESMFHTVSIAHHLRLTLTFHRSFQSAVRAYFDLLSRGPVYIMASQDLISQFSSDVNGIPPSQPDRSRTPPRHQHGWHQAVPAFRGPMHYAMTTHRPFWNPSGIPPPPPTSPSFPTRPPWTPPTAPFPPTPPPCSQTPPNNANFAPQRHPFTPRSPRPMSSPGASSTVNEGYTCRPIEIPPVEQWKPDVDFHDSNKINGLDFPSRIRQSRFSSYKDIEGMDPLQVPLWKFLYQGLHNTWLRRVAYGRETFVLPFDNIGTTVFVAELVSQLRTRNVDLDKLATFRSRSAGQCVNQKEATQNMAKEVAQLLQSWLPAQPSADVASQQRILELEAELAKMKSDDGSPPPAAPEGPGPATTPIGRALQGQPLASTSFDPSSLLISPGSVNPWLVESQPSSLTETQYKKWLKDLKLPSHKQETLEKQLERLDNDMSLLSKISILADTLAISHMVTAGLLNDNCFYLILKPDYVISIFVNKTTVITAL